MLGALTSAAAGAGASILAGGINSAMSYSLSKGLAKYNYELGQKSLRNSPSSYKEGLQRAGLNPMLAANANNVGSTQGGGIVSPNVDFSDSMSKMSNSAIARKQMESNVKFQDAQTDKAEKEGNAATMQAEASMMQAKSQMLNSTVNAQSAEHSRSLMDAQAANFAAQTGLSDQKLNYFMSHPEEYEAYLRAKLKDPKFQQEMRDLEVKSTVGGFAVNSGKTAFDVIRKAKQIKK